MAWNAASAAVALAAAAMAYALGVADSFWIDEVSSVALAGRTAQGLPHLLAWTAGADVHPPGFYLLLSGWGALFGYGEAAARALPALLTALAVFGVARLAARAFRPAVGLAAAALLGFLPAIAHYAVEVRQPAIVLALSVAAADAVLRVLAARARPRTAVWLGAVLALGLWGDYGFAPVAAALLAAALLAGGGDARAQLRLVGAGAGALSLFAPWVPALLYQALDLPAAVHAHLGRGPDVADLLAALGPGAGLEAAVLRRGVGILWAALAVGGAVVAALGRPRARPAADPIAADPTAADPTAADPTAADPTAADPTAADPIAADPIAADPIAADPIAIGRLRDALRPRAALAVAAGAVVVGGLGPALLAAALPLPTAMGERLLGLAAWAAALPALGAAGLLALALLGLRRGPRRPDPARVLGLAFALLLALDLGLHAARPFLLVRTALPLLPFAAVLIAGGLWRAGGRRALGLGAAALLAVAGASLGGPPPVPPRPDLRAAAAALGQPPAAGGPALVLPRWELPGLRHYAPDLAAEGVDDDDALGPALAAALAQAPAATVVLARAEIERAPAVRAALEAQLGGRAAVCADGAARGFRWLTFCRAGGGG
jgi:4-amino-4-deoxy-L-arabinose transferase-like glycosyltransferase